MDTAEGITDDVRDRLTDLKSKLDEADTHRPMSMMQCMVAECPWGLTPWTLRLQGVAETAGDAPSLDTSAFIKV